MTTSVPQEAHQSKKHQQKMRIIPVMDLKGGQVVHAVGGRRDEYQPIQSRLVASSEPEAIGRAFRDRLKLNELYVADLDAIAGAEPDWSTYRVLASLGLRLLVDAGVRSAATARAIHAAGAGSVVVGLETLHGPELLAQLVSEFGTTAVWFSLDLRNGQPICDPRGWPNRTAEGIVESVVGTGMTRLIVLDLACVGRGDGTGTEELCRRLISRHAGMELIAGGGIRDQSDLQRLESIGVSGVLVATALHTLRLPALAK